MTVYQRTVCGCALALGVTAVAPGHSGAITLPPAGWVRYGDEQPAGPSAA